MKKLLVLLVAILMVFCVSACTYEREELPVTDNKTTQQQPNEKETKKTPTSSPKTPNTNNYYQKQESEERKQISTTVAIANAIIVEDNHENNVVYKKKCDSCGYVEPGTFSTNPGSFIGGFYCPNCKETKRIEIKTTYSN